MQASLAYAKELANSNLLPGNYRKQPANVLFALEMGRTLGITAMAAITGIHVIDGKPSPSPALMTGLIRKAGHKVRIQLDRNTMVATATVIRADDPDFVYEAVWDLDRAVVAGLCEIRNGKPYARSDKGKPTSWEKYPHAMLKWRALSEVCRDAAEDCLFGLHYVPEELGVEVNEDGTVVEGEVIGEPVSAPPAMTDDQIEKAAELRKACEFAETKDDAKQLWREAAAAKLTDVVLRKRLEHLLATLPDTPAPDVIVSAVSAPVDAEKPLPDTDNARALADAAAASWNGETDDVDTTGRDEHKSNRDDESEATR
jgi:hypothetical protein